MNTMIRKVIACAIALASAISLAADMAAGKWERKTIDGSTPAIGVGEGLYLCENAASVAYAGTGSGTWTLPLGNVFSFGGTEICVRSGTLRISGSTTPDLVANPPAELQKAAIWLDATKNMRTEVIGKYTCVLDWFDARESSAAAVNYGYATAGDTSGDGPALGVNYVTFRGYVSNTKRSFQYMTVDGTATSYNIRHAFFVQRVGGAGRTAPILGNMSTANFFTAKLEMLATGGNANPLAYSSEYLVDGVHSDPTLDKALGTHLHEFTLPPNRTIAVDSLVRDRSAASGGYDIHEILLFTQPLTVLERMRISAYLKAKWSCGGVSSFSVRTKDGAYVELSDGLSPDSVEVSGRGALAIGSGENMESAHLYAHAQKERLPYLLKDGTSSLSLQATEYEYRLSPRERLFVDCQKKLSVLTNDMSGADGSATVTSISSLQQSDRPFVVSRINPAITNLTVSGGGDLVLRAPSSSDPDYVPGTASAATFSATSLSVPAGNTTAAETTVVVPAAGDWELAFNMSNTFTSPSDNAGVAFYLVQLKRGDTVVWERRPTAVDPSKYDNANQVKRYLLRGLAAGTYTLRAVGVAGTAIAASIADLSMTFVPNPTRETVVPVTDGDFESSRFYKAFFASRDNRGDGITEWTLTNGNLTKNPPFQAIVSSYMGYSGNYDYMFRSSQLGRYGDNALLWYHNLSTATSPATVLPAGTYRLRFDAVRWMTGTTSHSNIANGDAGRCNTPATLTASVAVNGGEPVSIGAVGPISNFTLETLSFPETITVSEGDSVTVTFDQTTENGAVQLDNFEFVKVEDGAAPSPSTSLGEELVQDGSCASSTSDHWTFDDWTGAYRHVALIRKPHDDVAFGNTKCDGEYVIRSAQGGRAYQTIAFPAGMFRLSWWSRARVDRGNVANQTTTTFWYAADGSPVTNEIVKSEISWCTNFTEHVAYFRVPTAGSYVFGFNSEDRSGADVLVDCVSVRQVLGPEATPEIPEYAKLIVTGGGKLRLDYNGCLDLAKVKVNGSSLTGDISAAKYPELISGPGRAFVETKGFVMTLR